VNASWRKRRLSWAVAQIRFGCHQLRRGRIDAGLSTRGRRRNAEARSRDTSGGVAIPVLRDARAPILAAPKEQQERHRKEAYQDARKGRRHIRRLRVDRALEGTWVDCTAQATAQWRRSLACGQITQEASEARLP